MNSEELRAEILGLVARYAESTMSQKIFIPGETPVPPSGKLIGAKELTAMVDASLDGWLTSGRYNELFEKELGDYIGARDVRTVNSGSSANLVAFSTLTSPKLGSRRILPGDEVVTVAAGFPTTVNPIVQYGAIPVFVDVDIATHNIDVALIEGSISSKTKAIMIAHTLGNPFDLPAVKAICEQHGLWLIEDCCDALGAKFDGKMVGTWGDIGTLSFYPAHHLTMGEGGAVFTNNPELALIAESFRDWGRDCYCKPGCDNTCGKRFEQTFATLPSGYDHKYVYSHIGYNLKITDMQAACGHAQLQKIEEFVKTRNQNHAYLRHRLDSLSEFLSFAEVSKGAEPSWFGFPITLNEDCGFSREDLLRYLDSQKVGTRLLFAGNLTRQPSFRDVKYRVASPLTNTDRTMRQTFWVGVQPALGRRELDYTALKLEEFFGIGF